MDQSIFHHSATPNINEKLFRSYCATGWAVAHHLQDLRSATDLPVSDSTAPPLPWRKVLENLDLCAVNNQQWTVKDSTLITTIDSARQEVQGVGERYKAISSQVELGDVLLQISSDIKLKSCEELREEFQEVNRRSHHLAAKCIQRYGSDAAKVRWTQCDVASLSFTQRLEVKCFVPTSRPMKNEIDIHVGSPPFSLKSYLTLEYQLFHEYLSHLFPLWDSASGLFSEGDMVALERWVYPKVAGPGLHILVLNARERELLAGSEGLGREWADRQEEMADEIRMHWISEGNLTRLLLDVAAAPEEELPFGARASL